jgi:hypothetical protein
MPDRPQVAYKNANPHLSAVCAALKAEHGVVEAAARRLEMDGGNLRKYIRRHVRCQVVQREAREKLGDLAESKLIALVNAGDYRAISLVLLTICRNRGYVLPKGTALYAETTNNLTIGTVNIVSVPHDRYLSEAPGVLIEGRDDDEPGRLN